MRRFFPSILSVLVCSSCGSVRESYPVSTTSLLREPTPQRWQSHRELLQEWILNGQAERASGAGLYAEQAYVLWRLGEHEQARLVLAKDLAAWPGARAFVTAFEQFLISETPAPASQPTEQR